jgi:AraC-like DNA-binding protein
MPKLRDNQLRVLWVSRIDYLKNSGVQKHKHDTFYQLLLVIEGKGEIMIDDQYYPMTNNRCYLLPQGTPHHFLFSENSTTIDFKFQVYSTELDQLLTSNQLSGALHVQNVNEFKKIFKHSCTNLKIQLHNTLLPFQIDVRFKSALLTLLQNNPFALKTEDNEFELDHIESNLNIVQYLKDHLNSKLSLEDLAKHFGYHPHYLIELFRKEFGTTPMNYLQGLRLNKAKEYLELTNLTITEISNLVGLTPPYLSRLVASKEGMSPSKYRETTRTVIGKDIILEEDFLDELKQQPSIWNQI